MKTKGDAIRESCDAAIADWMARFVDNLICGISERMFGKPYHIDTDFLSTKYLEWLQEEAPDDT